MTNKPTHPHQAIAHQLDASQVDEIAQLLTLAFEHGSGLSQLCKAQGTERRRRLGFLFRSGFALQAAAKQEVLSVRQDGRFTGIAIVQEPNNRYPLWAQIRWLLQVSLGISPVVAWHLWQSMSISKQYHPPEPHYYLVFLGVHPNYQGRGYARALLDALHARSEAHPYSSGVYLETANRKNVEFYQYFGYQLKTQVTIKGVETFILFRPNFLQSYKV